MLTSGIPDKHTKSEFTAQISLVASVPFDVGVGFWPLRASEDPTCP